MYPHQTDTMQIDAPEYNPDIGGDNQPNTDKKHATVSIQGTLEMIPESSILEDDNSIAPENITVSQNQQETNWPDAPTIQIPGVSSTTLDQPPEVMHNRCQVQPSEVDLEIPELEDNSDQDQLADLDTFITHHNMHQESEGIHQEYFATLQNQYTTKKCQDHYKQMLQNDPLRNSNNYSEKAEVKPDMKNSIATDHLATKPIHWRVVYNGKLRKANVCMKGILPIVNIFPL